MVKEKENMVGQKIGHCLTDIEFSYIIEGNTTLKTLKISQVLIGIRDAVMKKEVNPKRPQ